MFSAYNRVCFEVSRKINWSREGYCEIPAERMNEISADQLNRIKFLQNTYQLAFEKRYNQTVSRSNYGYLDMLDKVARKFDW